MTRYSIVSIIVSLSVGMAGGYMLWGRGRCPESQMPPTMANQSATLPAKAEDSSCTELEEAGEPLHPIDKMVAEAEIKNAPSLYLATVYGQAEGLWDQEMNVSYQKLIKEFPVEMQEQLRTTQRSWIRYRDQQQQLLRLFYGLYHSDGSLWRSDHASSSMIITKRRAKDLAILDWSLHFCP